MAAGFVILGLSRNNAEDVISGLYRVRDEMGRSRHTLEHARGIQPQATSRK